MKSVTFDGYEGGFLACPYINIWKDYGDRTKGVVKTVPHGSKGTLLEREGNRCKVQVGDAIGFVTFYFLLEEKQGFQAEEFAKQAQPGWKAGYGN